jgi:C1A family cysteine protease
MKHSECALPERNPEILKQNTKQVETVGNLPANFDWRSKGAVTAVKDQGQCGSCWSFSTTGLLEGWNFLHNKKLTTFSEQQIVDCDKKVNEGCNGGWPYLAVQYAGQNGLETEADYPYTAEDGKCKYTKAKATIVNKNYTFITPNSTDALKTAITANPISVLIEADQDVFQLYKSGVIWRNCGSQLDHAVLAVGWQKVVGIDSFIVKNSWGADWGQSGYVYISTNEKPNGGTGVCGILSQPVTATN